MNDPGTNNGDSIQLYHDENLRVLVADDNLVNQKVLRRMLNRLGVTTVDVVSDGKEAVEAESDRKYDLIFMDMQMPKMNGLDAVGAIRKRDSGHPQAKIVFLTGQVTVDFENECLGAGADGFLPKPCTLNSVKSVMAKVLKLTKQAHVTSSQQVPSTDTPARPTRHHSSDASGMIDTNSGMAPKHSFSEMRALIADDIAINQKVLKRILTRIGIQDIMVVDDGRKASDLEASKEFDVVFMDLQMPVMDGMEATRIITARTDSGHPPAKVIFVTAHVSDQFRKSCLETGAVGYLPKPCSIKSVKDCLQEIFPDYG